MSKSKDTLDRININTPCPADWDEMVGNDQVRFCKHCNLSVHNLSEMTRREAVRLVLNSKGKLCARYVRRPDGKIQTSDLVLHQISKVSRRASRLAAGAFTAALSLSSSVAAAAPATHASPYDNNQSSAALQIKQGRIRLVKSGNATLTGTVKDPNGAVVAGATVTLVNEGSGVEQVTTTNDEGVYLLEGLDEGTYTLKIEAAGFFATETANLDVRAGDTQTLDQQLNIAAVAMGGAIAIASPEEPLLIAVVNEDVEGVKNLLASGSDVNVLDKEYDSTALAEAVLRNNRELVKILLDAGADVNEKNSAGVTALMHVSSDTTVEVVNDLLAAGAKVDFKDESGKTALHHAVSDADVETLQALLDAGVGIDERDEDGRTALMIAASEGNEDNVVLLLKAGATVNLRDDEDKTALGMAKENDCGEVVDILAAYGGVE